MASEIEELIRKLREAEARRHAASLEAIAVLQENMIGPGPAVAAESLERQSTADVVGNGQVGGINNVDRVLAVLDTHKYMSLDRVMELSGLDEQQARTSLYARSLKLRIQKRKINKRMTFRLAPEPPAPEGGGDKAKSPSGANRVRDVLRQHPDGLRTGQIREELPDLKANTIGTALYNMKKKSKEVLYDESTETYRLA